MNAAVLRKQGNAAPLPLPCRIIAISPDLLECPTCNTLFLPTCDTKRYCCDKHRVTGCKRRRKRLLKAWEMMVTTMSGGRISAERAAECVDVDAERVLAIVAAWGWEFDRNDVLVRTNG